MIGIRVTENNIRELAEVVAAWMQFELLCRRGSLLSERMLSYPIAQFALSRNWHVTTEYAYPKAKKSRGRGPAADYAFADDCEKQPFALMESKWQNWTFSDDVARLLLLSPAADNFFMFAGIKTPSEITKIRNHYAGSFSLDPARSKWLRVEAGVEHWRDYETAREELIRGLPEPGSQPSALWSFETRLDGYAERSPGILVAIWRIRQGVE